MKKFLAFAYPAGSDEPNAQVLLEALDLKDAHTKAFAMIRKQFPHVEPSVCATIIASEIYSFREPDSS